MTTELSLIDSLSPDQMKLITGTIAKGATKDELNLFLYRCKSMGLDPLKPGQIHFVKYGQGPGTIVVGIDGFRARAQATGKMAGVKRGVIRDEKGKCVGAWCEVFRSDWKEPAREEVPLSEYDTGRGPWAKMPETMIKKVAEVAALRMAFPDDLGGLYSQEEMDQAKSGGMPAIAPEQPGEQDGANGVVDPTYRVPFGKFKSRSLDEIHVDELQSYIAYLEDSAKKKGAEIQGQVADFIERASDHIAQFDAKMQEELSQ